MIYGPLLLYIYILRVVITAFLGSNPDNALIMQRFQGQACAVAGHLYDSWSLRDRWHEVYVATKVSWATGLSFFAGRLEDLGYAQWGGGYVTSALWGVPSVLNIERKGYWKFGIASYTTDLIEFHSQAMAIGYSNMNMTIEDSQILLDTLSARGPKARAFRGNIGKVATSYRCDGSDNDNILQVPQRRIHIDKSKLRILIEFCIFN